MLHLARLRGRGEEGQVAGEGGAGGRGGLRGILGAGQAGPAGRRVRAAVGAEEELRGGVADEGLAVEQAGDLALAAEGEERGLQGALVGGVGVGAARGASVADAQGAEAVVVASRILARATRSPVA